ncbi:hypothetical protein [Marinobacter alkaliphilus]|uniref:Uncharacterized protein n=1 Tax=Marinobacter alkaliphilus TaxID=254719 RepID=A0ABZ3E9J2_9GAMM
MKMIKSFVLGHQRLNIQPARSIKETEIEDRATRILIDVKAHWDVEGEMEVEVIQLIRRELLNRVFTIGINVEPSPSGSSDRFDGPLPINF